MEFYDDISLCIEIIAAWEHPFVVYYLFVSYEYIEILTRGNKTWGQARIDSSRSGPNIPSRSLGLALYPNTRRSSHETWKCFSEPGTVSNALLELEVIQKRPCPDNERKSKTVAYLMGMQPGRRLHISSRGKKRPPEIIPNYLLLKYKISMKRRKKT